MYNGKDSAFRRRRRKKLDYHHSSFCAAPVQRAPFTRPYPTLMPFVASSTKTPEYSSASVVPSWVPKCTTSPWLAAESAGFTIGSCERVDVSSTPSPATHTTHLQHTKVEVTLPRRARSGTQVRRRRLDDSERGRVAREQHGEGPVRPVDLYCEVVPRLRGEGRLEEDVVRVVEDLERPGVRYGEGTRGVCERRACRPPSVTGDTEKATGKCTNQAGSQTHATRHSAR